MAESTETLRDVGEFGLIRQLTRGLVMPPAVSVGPGDDAAVFLVDGSAVVSTDSLVEGVDFRRDWSSAVDVGRKSVAVASADLEAMGARPVALVVALCAPPELPAQWAREFGIGVREEAERAGTALVGGDIGTARDVSIAVTVIGETAGCEPVLRSGAHPGQLIALKGRLGWSAAGHAALQRGFRSPRAVVDEHRVPSVPYGAGRQAAMAGATAMIDVSDGLLRDCGHLAQDSAVVIDLDRSRLVVAEPVATVAAALGRDPYEFLLAGGEDHALVAAFYPGQVPDDWQVIGEVREPGDAGPQVLVNGEEWAGATGWEHFRN